MKIGITCYPTYGGSGVVGAELGMELAERGHEVHFIASALPFRAKGNQSLVYFHEVEMMSYPLFEHLPYALALSTKMAEVVQAYDLDLLHVHYAIPHSVSAFLARSMMLPIKIPFITTLHGTDITLVGMDRSYWGITKFAIEQSDGITAISNQLKQKTLEVFGIEKNIEVIYNFVNCNKYQRNVNLEFRKQFAAEGEKILVHLSNFRPVKRTTDVVEIFSLVREKVPCKLILIGDGPDRSAAEMLIHKKGIQQHAFFLGKQENVEDTLGISDVLLLPSEMESFGLAALEAMACGAPPIASRVGGLPELVTHGVDGFLAEVGDVKAMADYAVRLLLDNELRQQMSKAGRRTAETRFCSTLIIPQYEKLYRRVAERNA